MRALAALLERYRGAHDRYPSAPGVHTLCLYPDDVGCALQELQEVLPDDPDAAANYMYQSDSEPFLVMAYLERPDETSSCPSPLPVEVPRSEYLYCAAAGAGRMSVRPSELRRLSAWMHDPFDRL